MKHVTHPELVARLRRAEGHLRSVLGMFDAGRNCVDIAQQLHAVEAAIAKAKRALIHDHIAHCLDDEPEADPRAVLAEMKAISKFL